MPCKILVFTKGYARYRENLFSATAEALPTNFKLLHTTPHFGDDLWEVNWDSLLENGGRISHFNLPAIGLGTFVKAIAHRFFKKALPETVDPNSLGDIAPDMIVIQEYSFPMLKAALYCNLRGIPCLVCSDLGEKSDWSQFSALTRAVHRFAAFLTTGLIAHTQTAKIPLSRKARPTIFIPHSVDIRAFPLIERSPHDGTVQILMVGQYIPRKGHDLLAKATRLLVDRGVTNFEIRLVGTQDPSWVKSVIEQEGLQDFITLLGVLKGERLFAEFARSDLFVLASRFDTFAVVVHEAAAFGLPLIVSKFAESSSLMISEGSNGYVVDPFDTEAFAEKLELLIVNPEKRIEMGAASRRIGESLCASKLGAQLAEWLIRRCRDFSSPPNHP